MCRIVDNGSSAPVWLSAKSNHRASSSGVGETAISSGTATCLLENVTNTFALAALVRLALAPFSLGAFGAFAPFCSFPCILSLL